MIEVDQCPSEDKKLSYFDVITDEVFEEYKDRGAAEREQFIISKEERDEAPLNCVYLEYLFRYKIYETGVIPNIVYLGNNPSDFDIIFL